MQPRQSRGAVENNLRSCVIYCIFPTDSKVIGPSPTTDITWGGAGKGTASLFAGQRAVQHRLSLTRIFAA